MSVQEGYVNQVDKLVPVINFRNPQELQKCFNFEVSDKPVGDEDLLEICQKVFDLSVKTSHPHFFNQLYAGIDAYDLLEVLLLMFSIHQFIRMKLHRFS